MKNKESKVVITIVDGTIDINTHLEIDKIDAQFLLLALNVLEKQIIQSDKEMEKINNLFSKKSLLELKSFLEMMNKIEV